MIKMTDRHLSVSLFLSASLAGAMAASGCRTWAPQSPSHSDLIAKGEQGPVRVIKRDGSSVILIIPVVAEDSLVGATQTEPPQRIAIAVADIRSVETQKPSFAKTMTGVQTTTHIVMGIILAIPTLFILSAGRFP
jgi:hypothetical protein